MDIRISDPGISEEKRREAAMVSMKDIARECGVSTATVSKALNGYSDIGSKTRERVLRAARRMGYLPNSFSNAGKAKRTYQLGVLLTDGESSGLTHQYFAHVLESFRKTVTESGYSITFISGMIAERRVSYLEHCRYLGVDGVLVANIDNYDQNALELIQSDIPLITLDHVFDNRSAVCSDNVGGMRELIEYIISLGHTRIAYIHGDDNSVTRARLSSFYRTMAEAGIDVPEEYVIASAYRDFKAAAAYTQILMGLPKPPTCILYADDICGIVGGHVLRDTGWRIGKTMSAAGYDGLFFTEELRPALTTVRQDTETIGREAAMRLIRQIEEPKTTMIEWITVPATLMKGDTVTDIRPKTAE